MHICSIYVRVQKTDSRILLTRGQPHATDVSYPLLEEKHISVLNKKNETNKKKKTRNTNNKKNTKTTTMCIQCVCIYIYIYIYMLCLVYPLHALFYTLVHTFRHCGENLWRVAPPLEEAHGHMATRQTVFLGYRFRGATRHRVAIPVVIPQFHLVGMTTLWRVAV